MFIRIANPADSVDRRYLEKLGISTKRNDADTIGQFGSGSKFAPIAALRNGWRWINAGSDKNGAYIMEYVSEEHDGINSIFFKYDDGTMKETSYTLDAGVLSWDEDFQIFREAFANALDEKIARGVEYEVSYVEEPYHEEGVFAVFITAAEPLVSIIENFDMWFSIERDALSESSVVGNIYNSLGDRGRVYYKGVFVHEFNGAPGIFDYEFPDVNLNEERRVRDEYHIYDKVWKAWVRTDSIDVVERIMRSVNGDYREWSMSYFYLEYSLEPDHFRLGRDIWAGVFSKVYGPKTVIYLSSNVDERLESYVKIKGYRAMLVTDKTAFILLSKAGVKTAQQVLGELFEFNIIEPSAIQSMILDRALAQVRSFLPDFDHHVNEIHIYNPDEDQALHGACRGNKIFISSRILAEDSPLLVGTLIHEYDHAKHDVRDGTERFRDLADEHIGNLVLELARLKGI